MPSYVANDEVIQRRQLKVQKVSIPLTIVGNAVAASVVPRNDEPARMFLQTGGVDQITGALASGETATYTTAPADATGVFRVLLKVNEQLEKVVKACAYSRTNAEVAPSFLGSATGITTGSAGGKSIMLVVDCAVDFTGANTFNGSLEIEYVVAD